MSTVTILALSGSLRKASTNLGLLRYAQSHAPDGMEIVIANLLDVPFFNDDLPERPAGVERLFSQAERAQGFLLACPEYNHSIAPALKNAIDWLSRAPNNRLLAGKSAAILGAGGGMGTSRAQAHLRHVLSALDLRTLNKPEVYSSAYAGGFNDQGDVIDDKIKGNVDQLLATLLAWTRKLA